jgi:hypothetical protein
MLQQTLSLALILSSGQHKERYVLTPLLHHYCLALTFRGAARYHLKFPSMFS